MNPKILTESGWKATAEKGKVKDNGLQRALSVYEKLADDKHEERLKGLASVSQLAGALKKVKEIAVVPEVVKYLAELISATQSEQAQITKAKLLAEKTQALAAKAEAEAKKLQPEEDADEEEEVGDYRENLKAAFKRLKGSKDLVYNFIVCDAKPQCGLIMSKQKINAKHRAELTMVTGGSKRFLKEGKCRVDSGKLAFEMEEAPQGLAGKLKKSFKFFTGITTGVIVGAESAEADEGEPNGEQPKVKPAVQSVSPALAKAPDLWHQTRREVMTKVDQLKTAIRKAFSDEEPKLATEIEQNMNKLDRIFDSLDHKLADSLAKANTAEDITARNAELKGAKNILADYIKYVKSETMITDIDSNPFGIKTNLKQGLTEGLIKMAQAIGRVSAAS